MRLRDLKSDEIFGTMSFPRLSIVPTSVPRLDTYTDHSIEIGIFPNLHRDIHIPRPVHREISCTLNHSKSAHAGQDDCRSGQMQISMLWSGKLYMVGEGPVGELLVGKTTIVEKTQYQIFPNLRIAWDFCHILTSFLH